MSKFRFVGSCLFFMFAGTFFTINGQQTDNQHFATSKNLDIFNSLFKELEMFYVDSIDAEKSIQTGIKAILDDMDPYTEYYPEDRSGDLKYLTTGEYAGIGAIITQRENKIIISDPYEGMPAALNGLEAGDQILEIDGESLEGKSSTYVSEKLKGPANTKVKIQYLRPGQNKPAIVDIERKLIHVNTVIHYGVMKNQTGYIYLSAFQVESAMEIKAALEDLKKNHQITSLIIDLRNNGGGVLDGAVQLVNMFVPKGEMVVSTKGKVKQWDRTYRTTQAPIDDKIPLVILVNENSASASEIVSGAFQDLDRAVIVGSRTYGKGLVQGSREVAYNGNLKLTISKYYIPSGRCIQAIDYTHRKADGSAGTVPDSLTNTFYTSKGRPVKDGGGITPDIKTDEKKMPNILYYLLADQLIFDYATEWKQTHKVVDPIEKFTLTDDDYTKFCEFVKSKNFKYNRQSEKVLGNLKEVMDFEGYSTDAAAELKALEEKLKPNLERDLDLYKEEISKELSVEIAKRYYFQKGELMQSLKNDSELEKALEVLANKDLYNSTLKSGI